MKFINFIILCGFFNLNGGGNEPIYSYVNPNKIMLTNIRCNKSGPDIRMEDYIFEFNINNNMVALINADWFMSYLPMYNFILLYKPFYSAIITNKNPRLKPFLSRYKKMLSCFCCEIPTNTSSILKMLLENEISPNFKYEFRNANLIHLAAASDNLENIKLLIEFGADLLALDESGFFPINYAKNEKCHKELMSAGVYEFGSFSKK